MKITYDIKIYISIYYKMPSYVIREGKITHLLGIGNA